MTEGPCWEQQAAPNEEGWQSYLSRTSVLCNSHYSSPNGETTTRASAAFAVAQALSNLGSEHLWSKLIREVK